MGSRFTLVVLAVLALALPSACAGKSIREKDGDSGAGGEPEPAGNGGKGGGSADVGGSDSSGGTAPRGGTGSPPSGGTTGAGATSGSGAVVGVGGSTSPGAGGGPASGGVSGTGGDVTVGGSGGISGCSASKSPVVPDPTGWIDRTAFCNRVGVQGGWFVFGDQYGDATCLDPGHHDSAECAIVTTPDPSTNVFPNVDGAMRTTGVVERLLPCPDGLTTAGCPETDYTNMWGAGIGFDLNADRPEDGGSRHVWPLNSGAEGIAFTITGVPLSGLRVEFQMLLTDEEAAAASPPLPPGSTTDDHPAGAPYWGAQLAGDARYPVSPVTEGMNLVFWEDVQSPVLAAYRFDQKRLLGVRFHLPTNGAGAVSYDFTISNVAVMTLALR